MTLVSGTIFMSTDTRRDGKRVITRARRRERPRTAGVGSSAGGRAFKVHGCERAAVSELPDLTRDLVRIPSHDDETRVGDAIEDWLRRETDAEVRRDDVGNVIARRDVGADRTLALVGHHDVVPPETAQVVGGDVDSVAEYVVEERGGRIYGRGAADMKGADAAMLLAFRDADPAWNLVFASFVGEELGGDGAQYAIREGFTPDCAIVAEGSTNYSKQGVTDVAVAHRGRRASTLVARGRAAHASNPEEGENAVYRACDAVDVVRDLAVPEATVLGHDVAGTISVTGIDGGSAWNVVPERCEVTVDERTVPGGFADLAQVEAIEGVTWEVGQNHPPMACDDPRFADHVLAAARSVQDGTPEQVVKPHATDAGWLAKAGVTCVVCGPSEPGEAHTATESVSVEVLERCRRLYQAAAEAALEA
jgi:acetylornithine deacetylase